MRSFVHSHLYGPKAVNNLQPNSYDIQVSGVLIYEVIQCTVIA